MGKPGVNWLFQCECGRPVPHIPHEPDFPEHEGDSELPVPDAKTESFFESLVEPQCGHFVPFQLEERTRISLSFSHRSQWNS
jgi:hypothetical protein